jgi:hypothetical protein
MNDPDAIRELLSCYALVLDADDIDECVRLFTEAAEFELYGRRFDSYEGIRTMFCAAPNGLHLFRRPRCRFITSGGLSARLEVSQP